MRTFIGLAVLVAGLAVSASTAFACAPGQKAYTKNGEDYCYSTSDGAGQSYTPSVVVVTNVGEGAKAPTSFAERRLLAYERRKHHFY